MQNEANYSPSEVHTELSVKVGIVRSIIVISVVLIAINFAVYRQVGEHEFVNLDDNTYVVENARVVNGITGSNIIWAFTTFHFSNWHPMTWLSHMADVEIYGMSPRGHHLTSVIIHTVSTVLLFLLLFRLTNTVWQSSFVAALFALHPLHVESVAWVAERKGVLSAFFWFLSLLFYAEYVVKRKPGIYLLTLFSFMLGLMSKPILVTLPLVMLLLDFWPLNRYSSNEQGAGQPLPSASTSRLIGLIKEKIPFLACSVLSSAVTIYAQHRGGSIRSFDTAPLWLRLENAIVAYVKYIVKTLWPHDLAVLYPYPGSVLLWQVICSLLVLLLVSAATIRAARHYPYFAVGWLWFLVTLLPVIGLIQVGNQSMADRYTYIPLTGLFIMAAWGVPELAKNLKYRQSILLFLAAAVIFSSAVLSWQQTGYWRDSASLFQHALHVTTGNYIMHNNLGGTFLKKGNLDAAIKEFQRALAINPDHLKAHYNLGSAFVKTGDLDAAIKEFQETIRIHPDFFQAHNDLGLVFHNKGDLDAAIKEFQEVLRIRPYDFQAHNNLGLVYVTKGDLDAAIIEFQEVLRIKPYHFQAHNNLGLVYVSEGNLDAAIKEFQEALQINPLYFQAHQNLERALAQKKSQKAGK